MDRPDFLEGRLEALREMKTKVGDALYNARLEMHIGLSGEMDPVAFKVACDDLMAASRDVLDHLDDEIVHARWKLSAARRRDGVAS